MRKQHIYLETSVWNFLFAEDAPRKRDITLKLFQEIEDRKYEIYVSEMVITEMEDTEDDEKRQHLLNAVKKYSPIELTGKEDDVSELVEKYLKGGVVPEKFKDDALHIAFAVVHNLDVIVSWNLRHIVKLNTRIKVNAINKLEGCKEIEICTPEEVIE